MEKLNILSGKAIVNLLLKYPEIKLYSYETKMDVKEIAFDKWYQVVSDGKRAFVYEVNFITTDSEVKAIFKV